MENKNIENILEDCVYNNPLGLTVLNDVKNIQYINRMLPFSVGFEIECGKKENINIKEFSSIPYIMKYDINDRENRFRIPNGIVGIVCLYNISEACKNNLLLNLDSGIHYHIDATKFFNFIKDEDIKENKEWILEELDSWEYKGTYNSRDVRRDRCWVRIHSSHKTIEFRIGEMTFDYDLWIRRILHCTEIVRELYNRLREKYNFPRIKLDFIEFKSEEIIQYISSLEKNLSEEIEKIKLNNKTIKEVLQDNTSILDVVLNRIIKIE